MAFHLLQTQPLLFRGCVCLCISLSLERAVNIFFGLGSCPAVAYFSGFPASIHRDTKDLSSPIRLSAPHALTSARYISHRGVLRLVLDSDTWQPALQKALYASSSYLSSLIISPSSSRRRPPQKVDISSHNIRATSKGFSSAPVVSRFRLQHLRHSCQHNRALPCDSTLKSPGETQTPQVFLPTELAATTCLSTPFMASLTSAVDVLPVLVNLTCWASTPRDSPSCHPLGRELNLSVSLCTVHSAQTWCAHGSRCKRVK